MDGNKYEGLQRDDTGNRRFYPIFAGQLDDLHGQPNWDVNFRADFSGFADDVWQIMAECKLWLEENGGLDGYHKYLRGVSDEVKEFSKNEMERGRGVVEDFTLGSYLVPALMDLRKLNACITDGRIKKGIWIKTAMLKTRIRMMSRGSEIKDNHLKTQMVALGFKPDMIDNIRGYLMWHVMSEEDYLKKLSGTGAEEETKFVAEFEDEPDF